MWDCPNIFTYYYNIVFFKKKNIMKQKTVWVVDPSKRPTSFNVVLVSFPQTQQISLNPVSEQTSVINDANNVR